MLKKLSASFLAVVLAFSMFVMPVAAQGEDIIGKKITVIHTNDVHARVDGEAFVSALAKELREQGENVLILSAGDALHGQPIATISEGKSIIDIMNGVGYAAMVAGNHDFNYGAERLIVLDELADFPILGANVFNEGFYLTSGISVELDGIKIGIFGLTTPETATKTNPKNVEGLTFGDPVETATEMVRILQEDCDVMIALTHLGLDEETDPSERSTALAAVEGIDLIVDGHSHTVLEEGLETEGALIVQTGEYLQNIGIVELTVTENGVEAVAKLLPISFEGEEMPLEADQEILDIIEAVNAENEVLTSQVVGYTDVLLQGDREFARKEETNLANLITDAMRYETGAQIAVTNGGGIRDSIQPGEITMGDVLTVLPFGNYIVVKEVSGADLLAALEHGVNTYPELAGHFIQVSGLSFSFDPSREAGDRVIDVVLDDGSELDLEATYVLATNDFMSAGGDDYTMLMGAEGYYEYGALDEALIRYLATEPEISEEPAGRILAIGVGVEEAVDEPAVDEAEIDADLDLDEEIAASDEAEIDTDLYFDEEIAVSDETADGFYPEADNDEMMVILTDEDVQSEDSASETEIAEADEEYDNNGEFGVMYGEISSEPLIDKIFRVLFGFTLQ